MSDAARRDSAVDPLRMLLAMLIVALHTGFPEGVSDMVRQVLVNGLYRLAVPIFAVISGYFFHQAIRTGRAGGYVRRILMLYVLWMMIYLPIWGNEVQEGRNVLMTLVFGYFHLWFLAGLVVAALMILGLVRAGVTGIGIAVLAAACAAAGLAGQYLAMTGDGRIPLDAYRNGGFVIFPYVAIGYLMAASGGRLSRPRRAAVLLALMAVAGESLIWYHIAGGGFGVDNMFSLLVAAPLVFLAALHRRGPAHGRQIASMSAFIYFIHILVMILASSLGLQGNPKAIFVMALCLTLACGLGATRHGRRVLAALT